MSTLRSVVDSRAPVRIRTAPPRIAIIRGPQGHPADLPIAVPMTESEVVSTEAEAQESNVCGRIFWRRSPGSRPPNPAAGPPEPSPVVVRRPTPGFIRNPGPGPERLPNPVSVRVRNPPHVDVGRPAPIVARNFNPLTVNIKVTGAHVVAVSVLPTLGLVNGSIAILVPAVPVVRGLRRLSPVFGRIRSSDRNRGAAFERDAALGTGDLH